MLKQRIFLKSTIGLCFSLCLLCPTLAKASSYVFDEEVAQGDGDPVEEVVAEVATKEEATDVDEDVATITAEGDFLVPTYLLPVVEDGEKVVSDVKADVSVTKKVTTTTTTTTKEVPIYVVSKVSEVKQSEEGGNDVSSDVLKAPSVVDVHTQALGTDEKIQPQPVDVSQKASKIVHNIGTGYNTSKVLVENDVKPQAPVVPAAPVVSEDLQVSQVRPVLIPLAPLPKEAEVEPATPQPVRKIIPSEYADKMLSALEKKQRPDFIMPQEIKVSFYKNASHFSGQTIKWIKAFSVSAMNDPRLVVQVRLSTQMPGVQQKRLSIIQNALIGNGLSPHQIQVIFTNRPADSLVLRTIVKPEDSQVSVRNVKIGRRVEKRTARW